MAKFTRKTKIAAVTVALVLGVSGTAYAYWTQAGTGTGNGTIGNTTGVVTANQVAVTGLYPGVPKALTGNFSNTNDGAVKVGLVSGSVTSALPATCLTSWFTVTGTTTPVSVPKGTDTATWSGLNVELLNNAVNQDVCKNATIVITYTVAAA